jgi:predicted nucleic acid-binding Zn ribbon protein
MTTYVYETIPADATEQPKLYELQQGMNEAPLSQHPDTGEPIRRVILGGYGVLKKDDTSSSGCCGGSGCC